MNNATTQSDMIDHQVMYSKLNERKKSLANHKLAADVRGEGVSDELRWHRAPLGAVDSGSPTAALPVSVAVDSGGIRGRSTLNCSLILLIIWIKQCFCKHRIQVWMLVSHRAPKKTTRRPGG